MQHGDHSVGFLFSGYHADGLVLVRVEFGARCRVDGDHLVALKCRFQLAQGGLGTFTDLLQRGFFDGQADGIYGPRTDSAIRDFEQAAGLRPSAEPNDNLLAIIARSNVKAKPAAPSNDPIAALLSPNRRVIAVQ